MLILTRKPEERIMIGPDIVVTVLGVHGGKVCIGITAPKNVEVDREEIRARKMAEREGAR